MTVRDNSLDIARDKLGKTRVTIVGLSRGGELAITREGYAEAYHLAKKSFQSRIVKGLIFARLLFPAQLLLLEKR